MHNTVGLKRDNHFLPVCYQKGFVDPTGMVWVKCAGRGKATHKYPKQVGKQRDLYIRSRGGGEDDKIEDFFGSIENEFAKLSERVKREEDQLSSLTGKELGALLAFVTSQLTRTLANKLCMEKQVGRPLDTNTFQTEMIKQMRLIRDSWSASLPNFEFHTCLPYVGEHFITGDDPILVVLENDNRLWAPADDPQLRIASPQELLSNPKVSFRVALSPHICVFLPAQGTGNAYLPPRTIDPSGVRWFNARISDQCKLFTLARDEASIA